MTLVLKFHLSYYLDQAQNTRKMHTQFIAIMVVFGSGAILDNEYLSGTFMSELLHKFIV